MGKKVANVFQLWEVQGNAFWIHENSYSMQLGSDAEPHNRKDTGGKGFGSYSFK